MEGRNVKQVVEEPEFSELEEGTAPRAMRERKRQQSVQRGARGREIQAQCVFAPLFFP